MESEAFEPLDDKNKEETNISHDKETPRQRTFEVREPSLGGYVSTAGRRAKVKSRSPASSRVLATARYLSSHLRWRSSHGEAW
jgi:hypothetical protein